MKRKIVKIAEEECNGCGLCIPNCPEGALQVIDGKARLVSDLSCDGLGACIGFCPQGAITIEEREAEEYSEKKVMENIIKQGKNVIKAHLEHLKSHNQMQYFKQAVEFLKEKKTEIPLEGAVSTGHGMHAASGCPGSKSLTSPAAKPETALGQWPVQLSLVPANAPYFNNADLAIVADCVPFAYADFHRDILREKAIVIACPKLDDAEFYKKKLAQIFQQSKIKSITVVHMEVPCCFGLNMIVQEALKNSHKDIPLKEMVIGIRGEIKS